MVELAISKRNHEMQLLTSLRVCLHINNRFPWFKTNISLWVISFLSLIAFNLSWYNAHGSNQTSANHHWWSCYLCWITLSNNNGTVDRKMTCTSADTINDQASSDRPYSVHGIRAVICISASFPGHQARITAASELRLVSFVFVFFSLSCVYQRKIVVQFDRL